MILKSGSRSRCSSTQKTVLVHIGNSGFCKRAKELVAPNIRLKSDMFAMIANITCHGCTEAETMTSHYIQPLDECRHNCHQQANVTPSLRFQVLQIQHRMCHYEVLISEVRVQVSEAIFQEMQAAFEKFYRIPLPEAVIQRALKPRSEHLSPPITRAPSLLSPGINHFHHNSNELILLIKIWYK